MYLALGLPQDFFRRAVVVAQRVAWVEVLVEHMGTGRLRGQVRSQRDVLQYGTCNHNNTTTRRMVRTQHSVARP